MYNISQPEQPLSAVQVEGWSVEGGDSFLIVLNLELPLKWSEPLGTAASCVCRPGVLFHIPSSAVVTHMSLHSVSICATTVLSPGCFPSVLCASRSR